ncbi:MAG: murein biosynthesis integral membrane protein MurJ [Rickettsiaceae bacterium]
MLIRSGVSIACLTFISRVFGLFRDLLIASSFGTDYIADSVNVAFRLPNLFRNIFAEGAISIAFVPLFNRQLHSSNENARQFASSVCLLLLIVLSIILILMEIYMPFIINIIAHGFYDNQEKFDLTILLCRITMPYLILISIISLMASMLNSIRKFTAFAAVPIILNIGIIISMLIPTNNLTMSAFNFSVSILFSGLLQLIVMAYCIKRSNLSLSIFTKIKYNKDIKRFFRNLIPITFGSGVQQINILISQSLTSVIPGAISIIAYADRLFQFPLAIIGITFNTILLPELSKAYHNKDIERIKILQNTAVKIGVFLSIPSSLGIILLSKWIIRIIYQHGEFTINDTINTAYVLSIFAIGLPAAILTKILNPVFYANNNTKTPLKISMYVIAINISLNIILMIKFGYFGIATGSAISSWCHLYFLYKYTYRDKLLFVSKNLISFIIKIIICSVIMIIGLHLINLYYADYLFGGKLIDSVMILFFQIICGFLIFTITAFCFKLHKALHVN